MRTHWGDMMTSQIFIDRTPERDKPAPYDIGLLVWDSMRHKQAIDTMTRDSQIGNDKRTSIRRIPPIECISATKI